MQCINGAILKDILLCYRIVASVKIANSKNCNLDIFSLCFTYRSLYQFNVISQSLWVSYAETLTKFAISLAQN